MDEKKEVPGEYVRIPSQGVFYKGTLKDLEAIKIRDLNWEEDDILTTEEYYKKGILFDELLKSTIIDEKEITPGMLVSADRDTLLWWLRSRSFGNIYKVPFNCKKCNKVFDAEWDLSTFISPIPPKEYIDEITETGSITIVLPLSNLKCKVTVPTTGRQKEVERKLQNKKEKTKSTKDFLSTGRLITVLEEVYDKEGKSYRSSEDILNWLRSGYEGQPIPLTDSRYIFRKAKEISLTPHTEKDLICPHCNCLHEEVDMPMTIYFFWPDFDEMKK